MLQAAEEYLDFSNFAGKPKQERALRILARHFPEPETYGKTAHELIRDLSDAIKQRHSEKHN